MYKVNWPFLISTSLVCTACATVDPSQGESRLPASDRQILVQTISGATMQVHRCNKIDSMEVNQIKAGELDPLMQGLLQKEGSVTEQWVTSLCGHRIEHRVFHGIGTDGRRAIFIGACGIESKGRSMQVLRLETAGNALSNWIAAGFGKVASASEGPTGQVKGLTMLMACRSSP